MKPFKTLDEQIEILKNRGLIIPDEQQTQIKEFLKLENYYNVINGYKDLFLSDHNPNLFKPNTAFHDIYTLHQLDRNFRRLLLPDLLIFETNLKSLLAYHFSRSLPTCDSYLNVKFYQLNLHNEASKLISDLSKLIQHKSQHNGPIEHYLEHYNHVPLWVLTKFMTFGQTVQMYRLLIPSLKNTIAKELSLIFNRDYCCFIELTPLDLESIIRTANFFRNICAHEERLYNFRLHRKPRIKGIANILNIDKKLLLDGHLFTMIAMLKLIRPKREYDALKGRIDSFFSLSQNMTSSMQIFQSVPFQEIMDHMGFPENWKSLI